jgi:hypothetical protein
LEILDNSNFDPTSLSSKAENIYSKLATHQQQIQELQQYIGFKTTQTHSFSLLPLFSKILQNIKKNIKVINQMIHMNQLLYH